MYNWIFTQSLWTLKNDLNSGILWDDGSHLREEGTRKDNEHLAKNLLRWSMVNES